MKNLQRVYQLVASIFFVGAVGVQAELAVIVHPSNPISSLNSSDIQQIFLGKITAFPSGERAVPITLERGLDIRDEFNTSLLRKTENQYKAYWAKLMFTGKGVPPKEMSDTQKVLDLVSKNPNLVGYVNPSEVTGSVKVVGKF